MTEKSRITKLQTEYDRDNHQLLIKHPGGAMLIVHAESGCTSLKEAGNDHFSDHESLKLAIDYMEMP